MGQCVINWGIAVAEKFLKGGRVPANAALEIHSQGRQMFWYYQAGRKLDSPVNKKIVGVLCSEMNDMFMNDEMFYLLMIINE